MQRSGQIRRRAQGSIRPLQRALILSAAAAAGLGLSCWAAANTELDVPTSITDLTSVGGTSGSDLTFTNDTYAGTTFTINGATTVSAGTLNDLDATQALTIQNSTASTAASLTLSGGSNSVSGAAAGDLLYVAANGNLTIQNGAGTLGLALGASGNFDIAGTATISSIISGVGGITKTGSGTLTLSGVNTFSGGLSINAGVVAATANTAFGGTGGTAGAVTINGGTLKMTLTTTTAVTNTHAINIGAGGGTINIANTSTGTPTYIMGSAGLLTGSGALTVTGSGSLVTGVGATTLVLGTANTGYTGNVTLQNGGIIEFASATGIATTGTFTVNNAGMLSINNVTAAQAVTVNSGGTIAYQNTNNGVISGAVTLNADANVRLQDWYGATVRNGAITGVISGAGSLSITSGSGTNAQLSVRGANTYQGGTTVTNSTLAVDANNTAGSITPFGSGTVTVNGNGTAGKVLLGAGSVTGVNNSKVTVASNFVFSNAFLYAQDQKQVLTGGVSIASGGAIFGSTYNAGGSTEADKGLFLNGVVSGSGAITIQQTRISTGNSFNTGFVTFGNNGNTYSGTITINENTTTAEGGVYLGVNAGNALQFATVVTTPIPGATLRFGNSPIVFNTGLGSAAIGALSGSGNLVLTGYDEINHAYGSDAIALTVGGNGSSTIYSGTISGGGSLVKSGGGAMTLSAANTFSGTTSVSGGTLVLTNSLSLQNSLIGSTSGLVFDSSVAGHAFTIGGLTGSNDLSFIDNGSNAVVLSFGNTSASYSGSFNPSNAVTKVGSGTQTLTGSNSFASGINLNGGTLALGSGGAIGSSGNIVFGGGALQYSTANTTDYSARIAAGTTGGQIAIDTGGQTVSFGTPFTSTQTGGLNKLGSGTLVMASGNSYTGTTSITAGTLEFDSASAMSSTSALAMTNGATLSLRSDSATTFAPSSVTFSNGTYNIQVNSLNSPAGDGQTLVLNGQTGVAAGQTTNIAVSSSTGDTLKFGASASYVIDGASGAAWGGITTNFNLTGANVILNGINTTGTGDAVFFVSSTTGNSLTINGTVANGTARTIGATVNSGILTLNNTVSNPGGANNGFYVTMIGGTLNINNAGAINTNAGSGNGGGAGLKISGGTLNNTSGAAVTLSSNPTLRLDGDFAFSTAAGTSANNLSVGTGTVALGTTAGTTRTITTNGAATLTLGGIISNGTNGTTPTTSLTKAGTGTLVLNGASIYSGLTSVSAGTLKTGAAGKLGTGNVSIAGGATLDLGGATAIADTATLTFADGSLISLSAANGTSESIAGLVDSTTSASLVTAGIYTASDLNTYFGNSAFTSVSGETLTIVPEPSSLALLGLGAAGLLGRRRRRAR